LRQFVAGAPARTAAELTGINRNTAILFFHKLREIIAAKLAEKAPFLDGKVEVDESYFGGVRKGKRGRGAAGKVPVFGLLKRGGKVHAVMIPDAKSLTLIGIIRNRIKPDSIVYTDSFRSYDVLDVSEFHHHRIRAFSDLIEPDRRSKFLFLRIFACADLRFFRSTGIHLIGKCSNHSERFADTHTHINGIENFWNQAKRHLRRYNGIPKSHFHLFLKECECRFNYRPVSNLLNTLKIWTKL
jgi:transposase